MQEEYYSRMSYIILVVSLFLRIFHINFKIDFLDYE